jgi:hypothetical protein
MEENFIFQHKKTILCTIILFEEPLHEKNPLILKKRDPVGQDAGDV